MALTEMLSPSCPTSSCSCAARLCMHTPRVEVSVHPQCLVPQSVQDAVFSCLRLVNPRPEHSLWLLPGWPQHAAIQQTAPLVSSASRSPSVSQLANANDPPGVSSQPQRGRHGSIQC